MNTRWSQHPFAMSTRLAAQLGREAPRFWASFCVALLDELPVKPLQPRVRQIVDGLEAWIEVTGFENADPSGFYMAIGIYKLWVILGTNMNSDN